MLLCVILVWPTKFENSLSFMQNMFALWEFKDNWLKILFLGNLGSIQVFLKSISSHTHAFYYALRSFCIKLLYFSKNCVFQIFDQSNLLLNRSKMQLKFWFELDRFDRCSIASGSIECNFWSIESNFRSIENRMGSFLKPLAFHVFKHFFKLSRLFLSLLDRSKNQSSIFVVSLKFFARFLPSKAGKTFLPLLFHLFSCFMHFGKISNLRKIGVFVDFNLFFQNWSLGFCYRMLLNCSLVFNLINLLI